MPITESNSSSLGLSGAPTVLVITDGVLIDGLDIYTVNESSFGLDSADTPVASEDTSSDIAFDQILCLTGEFYYQTSSAIAFTGDGAVFLPTPVGSGINNPPTGFVFNVIKKRKSFSDIIFDQTITVIGGYLIDDSCNPPTLTPNYPGWHDLLDTGWSGLTDAGWDMLGD